MDVLRCFSFWVAGRLVNINRTTALNGLRVFAACFLFGLTVVTPILFAAPIADVRNTRHNLSVTGPGTVKASAESQVCVFCHTPHGSTVGETPLWNRKVGAGPYTTYNSTSLDAIAIQGGPIDIPGGSSKLCLSCHDGTLAIGNVNVLNGVGSATNPGSVAIAMAGTGAGGVMPDGAGASTGFTRHLGTDLTNDHPISLNYTNALATRDGELRVVDANQKYPPGSGSTIGVRASGYKPSLPLEPTGPGGIGQVQCGTCHDPHLRETDPTKGNQKFLRQSRFQEGVPTASLNTATDSICVNCHDKNNAFGSWAYSAHANPQVATQTYTGAAASQRDFPAGLPVWKAACLNCHDTHTVSGARRLLREGTDSISTPKSGGNAALEETCYQCHTNAAQSVVSPSTTIPDIRTDFTTPGNIHMPITDAEVHNIGGNFTNPGFVDCTGPANQCGKDFIEPRALLGVGDNGNRHAECADCHNPHRIVKFRSFAGNPAGDISGPPEAAGTHTHSDTTGYTHTNIASGVLRGVWGVEPLYSSASFHVLPSGYAVKRGDPGNSADVSASAPHVTREYQICLKCHSDYGFTDDNVYPAGATRPLLGGAGKTSSGTNNLTRYTNIAKEVQPPVGHTGAPVATADSGAAAAYGANNHRSWHPIVGQTGRTGTIRGNGTDISDRFVLPWRNAVGTQTMYCSDCHGSAVASATSVIPNGGENGAPWGPHGSSNNFLLKGTWTSTTGTGSQADGVCFKCHNYASYATNSGQRTGFFNDPTDKGRGDLHSYHADKIGQMRCGWCHVAVPHGWKNKALLVNLNDVGPEAGLATGTQVKNNTTTPYNTGPYYNNAVLKVVNFRRSGLWRESDCGSAGAPGNGQTGRNWMRDSNENCQNLP